MIVDDEPDIRTTVKAVLEKNGYKVVTAVNADDCFKKIKGGETPDLILMDIIMPKLNGFATMAEIQKDEELKTIPIIVISNSGQPVELDEAKRLGARDWLLKTEFDPQELVGKIKAIIA